MAPSSKASTGSKDLIPKMKVEPQWTRSYLVDQVGVQDFGLLEYNFGKSANGQLHDPDKLPGKAKEVAAKVRGFQGDYVGWYNGHTTGKSCIGSTLTDKACEAIQRGLGEGHDNFAGRFYLPLKEQAADSFTRDKRGRVGAQPEGDTPEEKIKSLKDRVISRQFRSAVTALTSSPFWQKHSSFEERVRIGKVIYGMFNERLRELAQTYKINYRRYPTLDIMVDNSKQLMDQCGKLANHADYGRVWSSKGPYSPNEQKPAEEDDEGDVAIKQEEAADGGDGEEELAPPVKPKTKRKPRAKKAKAAKASDEQAPADKPTPNAPTGEKAKDNAAMTEQGDAVPPTQHAPGGEKPKTDTTGSQHVDPQLEDDPAASGENPIGSTTPVEPTAPVGAVESPTSETSGELQTAPASLVKTTTPTDMAAPPSSKPNGEDDPRPDTQDESMELEWTAYNTTSQSSGEIPSSPRIDYKSGQLPLAIAQWGFGPVGENHASPRTTSEPYQPTPHTAPYGFGPLGEYPSRARTVSEILGLEDVAEPLGFDLPGENQSLIHMSEDAEEAEIADDITTDGENETHHGTKRTAEEAELDE